MLHPCWIEREAPLARCPKASCRRSGKCKKETGKLPCERTHETKDAVRYRIAAKLDKMTAELHAKNPELKNRVISEYELELKLKSMKALLQASDEAFCASERAKQKKA
jgi:hypothetical protein